MKKNILLPSLVTLSLFLVASCGDPAGSSSGGSSSGGSSSGGSTGGSSVTLSVTPTSLTFDSNGGDKTVTVTCSSKPGRTSSDKSWLTSTAGDLSNNTCIVTVTAKANSSTSSRTGTITLKSGEQSVDVTVTQSGASSGGSTTSSVDPTEEPTALNNDAWAFSEKLGFGWNLGNHFDTYDASWSYGTKYNYWDGATITSTLFTKLKSYGFSSVRIPVTWYLHMNDSNVVDEDYLKEVAEVVGWARDAGLNVILNTHHDDADSKNWLSLKNAVASDANYKSITEKFNTLWNQIATYFKDEGDYLIFESFNEMHDGSWNIPTGKAASYYKVINAWNQEFVNTVRATGGNNATRMLGIPGYAANPSYTVGYLEIPNDSASGKIAVSVHDYDPYDYTIGGSYDQWGHTAASGKAPSQDESDYVTTLKSLYDTYLANNIPVYIGECGCPNKSSGTPVTFKKYYMEYTFKAMKSYGLAGFLWDNNTAAVSGDCHGYVNHSTGEYLTNGETYISLVKKAVNTTSSSYTLKSVYNSAPKN